jgi:replicative DNA helicase
MSDPASTPGQSQHESLPHSEECEAGLICSMMLDPGLIDECRRMPSEVFYVPRSRILLDTLRALRSKQAPIDFYLIKKALSDNKQFEEIGGAQGLNEIASFVPTAANWRFYLEHIEDYHRRRVTILACRELEARMRDPHLEADSNIREVAEQTLGRLALNTICQTKTAKDVMLEAVADIEDAIDHPEKQTSNIRFGLKELDQLLGGVRPGELVTIGAQTSGGKSALATQLTINAGKNQKASVVFSLEMTVKSLGFRMLANQGRLPLDTIRNPQRLTQTQLRLLNEVATAISNLPIYFHDQPCTIDVLLTKCRHLKVKHSIDIVVVDYLQLIEGSSVSRRPESREREVAHMSRALKNMAQQLSVTVIALSQLNDIGLLRESRAIGHDSNVVLLVHPEDRDPAKSDSERKIIEIAKHRDGPTRRDIYVNLYGAFVRFEDVLQKRPAKP